METETAPEKKPAEPPEDKAGHNSKAIDFKGAAVLMKTDLAKLSDQSAKTRGDQSASFALLFRPLPGGAWIIGKPHRLALYKKIAETDVTNGLFR